MPGSRGISAFLVEPRHSRLLLRQGRGQDGAALLADRDDRPEDCEVPAGDLLGEEGMGLRVALSTLDGARIGIAAQAVGIAHGASRRPAPTRRRARIRQQPIASLPGNPLHAGGHGHRHRRRAAARPAGRLAAGTERRRGFTREASMAKLYASEMANRVAYRGGPDPRRLRLFSRSTPWSDTTGMPV